MSTIIILNSKLNKIREIKSFGLLLIELLSSYKLKLENSFISNFNVRGWLFKKLSILCLIFFPINSCLADSGNRPVISYFVDNVVFEIIASGGYYSLATIVILGILASIFKKFREILFSILMAIFGIILLVFVYQALEDFDWLPEVY